MGLVVALMVLSSCSLTRPRPAEPVPEQGLPVPEIVATEQQSEHMPDSRMLASHDLTLSGYRLLEKQDYDGAIRMLERAVGLNPSDGPGYYYLAEAWLAKKNFNLANQFNGLASLYLRHDPAWAKRAGDQKKRINQNLSGM
jgi:tetratricopeptide (TPR) repeat protein